MWHVAKVKGFFFIIFILYKIYVAIDKGNMSVADSLHVPNSKWYNKDILKEEMEEHSLTGSGKLFQEIMEGTNKWYM